MNHNINSTGNGIPNAFSNSTENTSYPVEQLSEEATPLLDILPTALHLLGEFFSGQFAKLLFQQLLNIA